MAVAFEVYARAGVFRCVSVYVYTLVLAERGLQLGLGVGRKVDVVHRGVPWYIDIRNTA